MPAESVRTHSKADVPSLSLVVCLFFQNGWSQGCGLDLAFTDSSMETPLRSLLLEAYWKKLLAQDVIAGSTPCLCPQQCSQSPLPGEENTEAAF